MLARFLTTCSTEMQSVAVGWQVYQITHRALDLGLVGLAQFLPPICLFLFAGHVADRFPRQRILKTCYLGFSFCSLLLLLFSLTGIASAYPIYGVLVLNGMVRSFNAPASQAILPVLVPATDFPNAIAWSSSIFQTATIAGPMLGGVLYGLSNRPGIVYGCASVAYVLAFLSFRNVKFSATAIPKAGASGVMVLDGIRYIWRNKLILGASSLDLFAVLLGGAIALLPVYAREILHIGALGLGILRSAPGVGAVLTALAIARWPLRRRAGLTMLTCVFLFGAFTLIFGISHNVVISLLMLVMVGASDMISVIVRQTMIQLSTPDAMRGRVSAVNMVFIGASNEVGQFESGVTAHWFGTVPAVILGGVGTMAIVLIWSRLFPSLRRIDTLTPESLAWSGAKETTLSTKD
jgi:MFS family permease